MLSGFGQSQPAAINNQYMQPPTSNVGAWMNSVQQSLGPNNSPGLLSGGSSQNASSFFFLPASFYAAPKATSAASLGFNGFNTNVMHQGFGILQTMQGGSNGNPNGSFGTMKPTLLPQY